MVAYNLEKWRRGTLVLKEEAAANCRTTVLGKDLCDVNVSIDRSASFTLTKTGINCEATNRDTHSKREWAYRGIQRQIRVHAYSVYFMNKSSNTLRFAGTGSGSGKECFSVHWFFDISILRLDVGYWCLLDSHTCRETYNPIRMILAATMQSAVQMSILRLAWHLGRVAEPD